MNFLALLTLFFDHYSQEEPKAAVRCKNAQAAHKLQTSCLQAESQIKTCTIIACVVRQEIARGGGLEARQYLVSEASA